MKKIISALLTILVFISLMAGAYAVDASRHYDFILSCNGDDTVSAEEGSVVTVTLRLRCIDTAASTELSAFQTEICYDDEVLEYVGSDMLLPKGVEAVDISTDGFGRRIRVSYALPGQPELFSQQTDVMNLNFKVLKEIGRSSLTQENFLVSNEDGSDIYESTAEEFIIVTEHFIIPECSVVFESMNGEPYQEFLIIEGGTVSEPETIPVREGYEFSGWYTDNTFTKLYDFTQPVVNSMTLYAKWEKLDKPMSPWVMYAAAAPLVIGLIVFIVLRKRDKDKEKNY